jgi:hypothetical protein
LLALQQAGMLRRGLEAREMPGLVRAVEFLILRSVREGWTRKKWEVRKMGMRGVRGPEGT